MMAVSATSILMDMEMTLHIPPMHMVGVLVRLTLSPHILLVCSSLLPVAAPGRLRLSLGIWSLRRRDSPHLWVNFRRAGVLTRLVIKLHGIHLQARMVCWFCLWARAVLSFRLMDRMCRLLRLMGWSPSVRVEDHILQRWYMVHRRSRGRCRIIVAPFVHRCRLYVQLTVYIIHLVNIIVSLLNINMAIKLISSYCTSVSNTTSCSNSWTNWAVDPHLRCPRNSHSSPK